MSEFDRVLRGLSSREMLECARGLLECLTGGASASGAADIPDIAAAGRGDTAPIADAERGGRDRVFRGVESARRAGSGSGGESLNRHESVDWEIAYAENGGGRAGVLTAGDSRRVEALAGAAARPGRGGVDNGGVSMASGAAFCGPERRYDGAVGARGMEMSRVSEFFKRDSRRYDAGYPTFS